MHNKRPRKDEMGEMAKKKKNQIVDSHTIITMNPTKKKKNKV